MLDVLLLVAALQAPPSRLLFDYSETQLKSGAVNRFELSIDSGPWVDIGRTAAAAQDGTPAAGTVTYQATFPALTLGEHTAAVRACNPVECSDAVSLTFVISVKPSPVTNLRIGGGS